MKTKWPILVPLVAQMLACSWPAFLKLPAILCPEAMPEPFWVEPVPAVTAAEAVTVEVYAGNAERVTVVTETGAFSATGRFSAGRPILVEVRLISDMRHHLEVTAWIAEATAANGCEYGGYTLSTTHDRNGALLLIVHQDGR